MFKVSKVVLLMTLCHRVTESQTQWQSTRCHKTFSLKPKA